MRNLLNAGFSRLWRSASFWVAVGVMSAVSAVELALSYQPRLMGAEGILDNRYMIFALMSGVVLSAFCSLFVGSEYSDGTMRNKIAVGHSRTAASIVILLLVVAAALISTTGIDEVSYLSRNLMVDGNADRMANWQLALDILPTGQYYQVSRLDTPNLWRMPLLSLAVIAASTGAGLFLFHRKDLK